MVTKFGICLLLAIFLGSNAQVTTPGVCLDLRTEKNFDAFKYSGIWYEYERFFAIFQAGVSCARAIYTPYPDGRVGVINTGFRKSEGRPTSISGVAAAPDPNIPGRLSIQFQMGMQGNYWVLDTDYKTYSVVYSCTNRMTMMGPSKAEIVYILTRQRGFLSPKQRMRILTNLSISGIDVTQLRLIDQTQCPIGL